MPVYRDATTSNLIQNFRSEYLIISLKTKIVGDGLLEFQKVDGLCISLISIPLIIFSNTCIVYYRYIAIFLIGAAVIIGSWLFLIAFQATPLSAADM